MNDEKTPALRDYTPRSNDATVLYKNTEGGRLPVMMGLRSQYSTVPRQQPESGHSPVLYKTGDGEQWTREQRIQCWMFFTVAFLMLMMVGALAILLFALFAESGTWTKIARMTDTGDALVQRFNDSQLVESIFFAAQTWQNGNYTEILALTLTRTQGNILRLMDTLDAMDWNQFKVVANATLLEVVDLLEVIEGFINGGFQITIPLPRP